jgi:glutaminyl-tRNA synthetase
LSGCKLEPSLAKANSEVRYQFERLGYFRLDPGVGPNPVFIRTVSLRDSWAKEAQKQ